jgi:hypothetical protein
MNVPGSFYCKCLDGFESLPATIKPEHELYCEQDINECELDGCAQVSNSTCVNTYGSFTCVCAGGYELNKEQNACVDVDECVGAKNNCARGTSTCVNTEASFVCVCNAGFLTPEESDMLGNCSLAHVEKLLFKEEDAGVRILFPSKGSGALCKEVDECLAQKCASFAEECIESNRTAEVCDSLQWFVDNTSDTSSTQDANDTRRELAGTSQETRWLDYAFAQHESPSIVQSAPTSGQPATQTQMQGLDVSFTDGALMRHFASKNGGSYGNIFTAYARRALANASNSSLNGSNGTDESDVVKGREEGLLVRRPLCGTNSECYNSIGSFQVCLRECMCVCVCACKK